MKGFGEGLLDGAVGLVVHPITGLSRGGLGGAVKGLGKGVMGAISKPLSGAVGLLAQTSQGNLTLGLTHRWCENIYMCKYIYIYI